MMSKKEKSKSYEWIRVFEEAFSKIDSEIAYDDFQAFNLHVGNFVKSIQEAQFIVNYRLRAEASDNMTKRLNFVTEVSYNLIMAAKNCAKALNNYISLTNNLYHPMQMILKDHDFYIGTKEAKEMFVDEIDQIVNDIKPFFTFINKDLKKIIKEKELKENELRTKTDTLKRKNHIIDKFITKDAKRSNCVKIYINLMKTTHKKPNSITLALASSENRISKSTWARILNETAFLKQLSLELEKLIKRTKKGEKRDFYTSVFYEIELRYAEKIKTDFEIKGISFKVIEKNNGSFEDQDN